MLTVSTKGLFSIFLKNLPVSERQFHNCNCCRDFVKKLGGAVTVDNDGSALPVMWPNGQYLSSGNRYFEAIQAVNKEVKRRKVIGKLIAESELVGDKELNGWDHFYAKLPVDAVFQSSILVSSIEGARGEFQSQFELFKTGFDQYHLSGRHSDGFKALNYAIALLESGKLWEPHKVVHIAKALRVIAEIVHAMPKFDTLLHNFLMRETVKASIGLIGFKNGMLGFLMDTILTRKPENQIVAMFNEKMDPTKYRRPQVAPKQGTIETANRMAEANGYKESFKRRTAVIGEVPLSWSPLTKPSNVGMFSGLTPHTREISLNPMTWAKFITLLPSADKIEVLIKEHNNFIGITTQEVASARPIIKWDNPDYRNPFAWYTYASIGSLAAAYPI